MTNKLVRICCKTLSLILSAVLIFQSSAPAYAQAKKPVKRNNITLERNIDRALGNRLQYVAPADNTRVVRPLAPDQLYPYMNNPAWKEAQGISTGLLMGGKSKSSSNDSSTPLNYEQFKKEYTKSLNDFSKKYKKENEAYKKQLLAEMNMQAEKYLLENVSEADVLAWKEIETKNIEEWFAKAQAKVDEVRTAELAKSRTKFKQYQAETNALIDKANKEMFKKVQGEVRKLFALYKKNPGPNANIAPILLETVPLFIPMSYNGENLLNSSEQKIIFDLAIKELNSPFSEKTRTISSRISAMTAIVNLKSYGTSGGYAIKSAVIDSFKAPQFHSQILLTGVSALLAMKDYSDISGILAYFNAEESKVENVDMLSVSGWVSNIQALSGKYLGKASSLAQYQLENGTIANTYTDIALMLAEEGSPEALTLLKQFGVDKCVMTLDFNLKDTYSPSCGGIKPFVAGALISGKAGAEKYAGPFRAKIAGSQEFTPNGRISIVTQEQAKRQTDLINSNINRFRNNVRASGFTANGYIAINLLNESMTDIEGKQEAALDKALYKKYKSQIKSGMLGQGAIINQAKMDAKAKTQKIYKYAKIGGTVIDIGILVWCIWDITKLARGFYSLGRGAYSAFRLSRIGTPAQRMAYITSHMPHLKNYASVGKTMAKYSANVKNAMEPIVLGQRALYTSAPLPKIMGAGLENTTVAKTLAATSFDAAKGAYVVDVAQAYRASAGQPGRVVDIMNTKRTLESGAAAAQQNYLGRGFFDKYRSYGSYLSTSTKEAFQAGGFDKYSLAAGVDFANGISFTRGLKWGGTAATSAAGGTSGVKYLARPTGTEAGAGSFELFHRATSNADAAPLPVNITIESKIPNVKTNKIKNVVLTGEEKLMLSFDTESKFIDPSFFKIAIDNPSFATVARMSTVGSTPLNIKFMAQPTSFGAKTWQWGKNLFGGKKGMFTGTGQVFVREGAALRPTSISLSTSKPFNGVQVIVNENNTLSVLGKSGEILKNPYSFALPKGELSHFTQYAKLGSFNKPFHLALTGGQDKLMTLNLVQLLSLSAASTSLVGPLRTAYPDMSNTNVALISMVLPYATSFLSPFWAPFVKRFGSANMVKASLGLAATSLAVPMVAGFNGFGNITASNPDKPAIGPLLWSAGFVGLSSSITRSAFNPLMDAIGGGAGLLRGMAFKNLSSFTMLAAPAVLATIDFISPDNAYKVSDKTDFFLSYPILFALSSGILYKFQASRLPTHIGKVEGYKMSNYAKGLSGNNMFARGFNSVYRPVAGTLAETWNATKVLANPNVLPVTLAATAALGVESSLLYNYSQTEANRYAGTLKYVKDVEAWKPVVATAALAASPLVVRLKSKPILNFFGGADNPATYKRLVGASLATAGAGATLLATEDNMGTFALGMALTGIGFANTTNGLLKIGEFNLKRAAATKSTLTAFKVAYPGVHIGMAITPKMFSGAADADLAENPDMPKYKALQNNINIPVWTLGAAGGFYGLSLVNPSVYSKIPGLFSKIPTGLPALTRFGLGSPSAMFNSWGSAIPSSTGLPVPAMDTPSKDLNPEEVVAKEPSAEDEAGKKEASKK